MGKEYFTVAEYAEIKGISKQTVYNQLKKDLKDYLIVIEGKKCIKSDVFNQVQSSSNPKIETDFQDFQPKFETVETILKAQIEDKDRLIERLLEQADTLQAQNANLTEQIGKLTELLNNSQVLLAVEKNRYIEQETQKKEKKGIFRLFRKK
jgi:hypothetical protein